MWIPLHMDHLTISRTYYRLITGDNSLFKAVRLCPSEVRIIQYMLYIFDCLCGPDVGEVAVHRGELWPSRKSLPRPFDDQRLAEHHCNHPEQHPQSHPDSENVNPHKSHHSAEGYIFRCTYFCSREISHLQPISVPQIEFLKMNPDGSS